jgi:hypothetical protein
MREEQLESQPGFFNDCKAWGDWMANRYDDPAVVEALKALDVAALLSHRTEGMDDAEVDWVTPNELAAAAQRLGALVRAGDSRTERIVASYALSANDVDPVEDEFARDLEDVAQIAEFAKSEGVERMTLDVNW